MFTKAIKRNLNLQLFKVLCICANYSTILRKLDGRFQDPEVRCAFTVFQLMTILEENHHSFLIVEYLAQTLKQTSWEVTILLYAPALDPHLQKMTELADRVFCFYEGVRAPATAMPKLIRRCKERRKHWRHTHEMAMETEGGTL